MAPTRVNGSRQRRRPSDTAAGLGPSGDLGGSAPSALSEVRGDPAGVPRRHVRAWGRGHMGTLAVTEGSRGPSAWLRRGAMGGTTRLPAWWAPNAPDLEAGMRQEAASRAALSSSGRLGQSGAPRPLGAPLCGPSERPGGRCARPSRGPVAGPRALCERLWGSAPNPATGASPRGSHGGAARATPLRSGRTTPRLGNGGATGTGGGERRGMPPP